MRIFEEEFLEPIARYFRFKEGLKFIKKNKPLTLVDLGCGPKIRFYYFAKKNGIKFKNYVGIDSLANKSIIKKTNKKKNIKLLNKSLVDKIPLPTKSADYIVGFAFLEHIENPEKIITDSVRILKIGGRAIFTTPSIKAKKVLKFLSFKLGLISKKEIAEHKNYFDRKILLKMLSKKNKEIKVVHKYFEFGLNNLVVIKRIK